MDIQEMIMRNAEDKKTLEELKEKVLDGERKVFSAILEEIAEKTGASFENNKLNTFSGVFRIGYPYADSQRLALLYYNVKKNGEESTRCGEHIYFGGGYPVAYCIDGVQGEDTISRAVTDLLENNASFYGADDVYLIDTELVNVE